MFYLKCHRVSSTSAHCIQQWVDVINELDGYIYFVCDNTQMKELIIKNIRFYNRNFDFLKSDRKTLKFHISNILNKTANCKRWRRVAYSMLTPFVHAAKNQHKISYNIDGDDILMCAPPEKLAEAFIQAEKYCSDNNVDLFNFDMFVSRTYGVHWSFGCVLCTNPQKCLDVVKNNINWRQETEKIKKFNLLFMEKYNFNIDWFFTYLRDTKQLNIKTFYVENLYISHEPDNIMFPGWSYIMHFTKGKIEFDFNKHIYKNDEASSIDICDNNVKIDINLSEEDFIEYSKACYNKAYLESRQDMSALKELQKIN